MLDLRRLRYFAAVAAGRSFSGAADELLVAQSAVSRQVALLEATLGVSLLVRSSHSVELTAEGEDLLPAALALLRDAAALEDRARSLAAGRQGRLVVGYSTSLGYETAPALMEAARRRLPEADVDALLLSTPRLVEALLERELDLAVVRCPTPAHGLTSTTIRREHLGVVVRADHPLARAAALDLTDIRDERLRLHDRNDNPAHFDAVVGVCRTAGFEPQVVDGSAPFDPAFGAVAGGEAVAIVQASAAAGLPAGLTYIPLTTADTIEIALLARDDEDRALVLSAHGAMVATAEAMWSTNRDRRLPS